MDVSILGCGWLGVPFGERLIKEGFSVKGSTTSENKFELLKAKGIEPFEVLLPIAPLPFVPFFECEVLVISITPGLRHHTEDSYLEKIRSILEQMENAQSIKHAVFITSTAIYENSDKEVFEEEPNQNSVHYKAEQLLKDFCIIKSIKFTSARCGGLMGYDRFSCKYIKEGVPVIGALNCVNYIHRDDVIEILVSIIKNKVEGVFNLVSPEKPKRIDVYKACCKLKNIALPIFDESYEPFKIVNSEKIISELDYNFLYPNPLNFP